MFKEERDETQFEWSMLGDIEKGRPNLGPMVHVAVYRLMQFTLRRHPHPGIGGLEDRQNYLRGR